MATIHTISCDLPLALTANAAHAVADCGKQIEKPQIAFLWDQQLMDSCVEWAPNVCRKCRIASDSKPSHYVYGVARGQEPEEEEAQQ